jgi:glycosyltransferase involved in cell wall biosynthesis
LKVLIVSPVFWPESFRINDLAEALVASGHEVEVLAGMPNYSGGKFYKGYGWLGPMAEVHEGMRILRFPVRPRGKGRSWELLLHYGSWLVGAYVRLLWGPEADWDVVFVCQTSPVSAALPALLARKLSGAWAVIWVQDLWPDIVRASGHITHPWLIHAIGWFSNWIYRSFDHVITQSEGFKHALEGRGIPEHRLTCIHNWAENLYGEAGSANSSATMEPWQAAFVVMFAGNLGRVQGLPTILDAAERIQHSHQVHWVILGDGVLAEWMRLEVQARRLQSSVWLLGRHPVERMPSFFAKADVLLLSLGRSEALALTVPSKLQSYLASGKPILGSVDGEAARLIQDSGAGWAVPAEDPIALANQAIRISGMDSSVLKAMGKSGQAFYGQAFQREKCLKDLERTLLNARVTP